MTDLKAVIIPLHNVKNTTTTSGYNSQDLQRYPTCSSRGINPGAIKTNWYIKHNRNRVNI